MDSTQRRRRNSYDQPNQLQYRTNRGPIPLNVVPEQLQNAPPVGTRTASGYPDIYRNKEGLAKDSMQNFPTYTTGPGRAAVGSVAGILHEYPIQTPNDDHRFDYNRRVTPARKVEARQNVPPNQRAYVTNLPPPPPNDPFATRAAVRVVDPGNGEAAQNVVVGVIDHPPGNKKGFDMAPIEPIDREGR